MTITGDQSFSFLNMAWHGDRFVDIAVTREPVTSLCENGLNVFGPQMEKTWTSGSIPLDRYLSGVDIWVNSLKISQTRYVKVRH